MRDELDRLKEAFADEAPLRPRDGARRAAIDAALKAFDEENAKSRQGSAGEDRLKERGNSILHFLFGRRSMHMTQTRLPLVLAGGASLAALALAIVNVPEIRTLIAPPKPVSTIAVAPHSRTRESGRLAAGTEAGKKNEADALTAEVTQPVPASPQLAQEQVMDFAAKSSNAAEPKKMARQFGGIAASSPAPAIGLRSDGRMVPQYRDQGRDKFSEITPNPVKVVKDDPVSTFSIDVDTASYSFMRASLNRGVLPQKDAVRVEELINYFPYDYQGPSDHETPFKASVSVFPTPWNTHTKLIHIGIKGYTLPETARPHANLVFLIDTSGSMNAPNKLPLLRNSFRMLLSSLRPDDTVSIVVYAGSAGTVLEPTKVADKAKILAALDNLSAGGSTAGAEGIRRAYQLAEQSFDKSGLNRVILATDGDFNVGITNTGELKSFVERQRQSGIYLSVLGFGMGNYNDKLMQALAQNGNGNAAYIDNLNEARKVLVEEAGSTLFTIANDVKLQVEFNPQTVSEYRLIGYETRLLNREDFNNDKVDAGDIGAGHTVTAIYEITPKGSPGKLVDDLRYQAARPAPEGKGNEYAFLKIRYKLPGSDKSKLITTPITTADETASIEAAPREARFATAVAGFGQILRGGRYTGSYSYDDVIRLAQGAKGTDEFGYRTEFVNLVRLARTAAALEPLKQ